MKARFAYVLLSCLFILGTCASLCAQWSQWGHDAAHNGYLPDIEGQPLTAIRWSLVIDTTAPTSGDLLVHYAAPLIDDANNIYMTKKERIDGAIRRSVMKISAAGTVLCSYPSDYVPFPLGWEPVFHPVLANGILYVPGARGILDLVDPSDCSYIDTIAPYTIPDDPTVRQQLLNTVFVAGVPTVDDSGNVFYPFLAQPGAPLGLRSQLVKVDVDGNLSSVTYQTLTNDPTQHPPINAGAAIGPDGTLYVGSVGLSAVNGWLVAANPDLTPKWKASMASDPARVAQVIDISSSCPVVGPDGRIFYGGWNANGQSQGYLYSFSPEGRFLGSFEFGWDTTPAIYPDPDGDPAHYHLVQKYNRYLARRFYMVSINPNTMQTECQWELVGREWCINAPAIDTNGIVYTNGEDGFLYALSGMYPAKDGTCSPTMTRIMLDRARDAAYTPLSLGPDGTVYTLNNARMFAVGNRATNE